MAPKGALNNKRRFKYLRSTVIRSILGTYLLKTTFGSMQEHFPRLREGLCNLPVQSDRCPDMSFSWSVGVGESAKHSKLEEEKENKHIDNSS